MSSVSRHATFYGSCEYVLLMCCLINPIFCARQPAAHRFSRAVDLYTKAIELNADNAVLYANRAFAHTRLEEYGSAIADATKSIECNPKYVKVRIIILISARQEIMCLLGWCQLLSMVFNFKISTLLVGEGRVSQTFVLTIKADETAPCIAGT